MYALLRVPAAANLLGERLATPIRKSVTKRYASRRCGTLTREIITFYSYNGALVERWPSQMSLAFSRDASDQTVLDLCQSQEISDDLLKQAFSEARERGLITRKIGEDRNLLPSFLTTSSQGAGIGV
jgi:hypothetical protein